MDDVDKDLLTDTVDLTEVGTPSMIPLEKLKMDYCYAIYVKADKNIARTSKILEVSPNTLKAYLNKKKAELGESSGDDEVIDVNL